MKKLLLPALVTLIFSSAVFANTVGDQLPSAPSPSIKIDGQTNEDLWVRIYNYGTYPVYITTTTQPGGYVKYDHALARVGDNFVGYDYPDTSIRVQVYCSPNPIYSAQMDVTRTGVPYNPPGGYYPLVEIPATLCTGFHKK